MNSEQKQKTMLDWFLKSPIKKTLAGTCLFFLTFSFVLSGFFFYKKTSKPKEAEALVSCVLYIIGLVAPDSATKVNVNLAEEKRNCLNAIAILVGNILIEQLTNSIINWINSGFEGKPSFLSDLRAFGRTTLNQAVGQFFAQNKSLQFLCSPFKLNIQIALLTSVYRPRSNYACTLDTIVQNVDAFVNEGKFSEGGWPGWLKLTQGSENSIFDVHLTATQDLKNFINNIFNQQDKELQWGKGVMSVRDIACKKQVRANEVAYWDGTNFPTQEQNSSGQALDSFMTAPVTPNHTVTLPYPNAPSSESQCPIVTPGTAIENYVNMSTSYQYEQLHYADSMDKIFTALVTWAVKTYVLGPEGLLGAGSSPNLASGGPQAFDDPNAGITADEQSKLPATCDAPRYVESSGGTAGKALTVTKSGVFFIPTREKVSYSVSVPMAAKTNYKKLEVNLDLTPDDWYDRMPSGLHSIVWAHRGASVPQSFQWRRGAIGYINFRGPGQGNTGGRASLIQAVNFNREVNGHCVLRRISGAQIEKGKTYHVQYIYDTANKLISTKITNKETGGVVAATSEFETANIIQSTDPMEQTKGGAGFSFVFGDGQQYIDNADALLAQPEPPPEVPTLGWKYADLEIKFTP